MGNTLQTLPPIPQEEPTPQQQQRPSDSGDENQEFTCEICIEPTSYLDKKFRNSDKCSHPFCTDCMIKYIRVKLEDDNVGRIKCPAFNCDRTLDPHACASLVGESLFVRWCDVLCEDAIVGLDKCYCPYSDCNALIVNECGGNAKKCSCPKCKRWLCFECKRVWHAGFGCEESGELRDGNDVAFGRLVEQRKWMRCPRCRHFVELVAGCQTVKCRCGITFCYKCGQHRCRCCSTTIREYEYYFEIFLVVVVVIFVICLVSWAETHKEAVRRYWKHH